MARRRRGKRYSTFAEDEGLNLTPLLDVIFNLIFFFILATTIRSDESFFDLILPQTSEAAPQELQDQIPEILVSRDGSLMLNGKPVAKDELRTEIERMVEEDDVKRVVLSADAESFVQQSVDVMDLLRAAGIEEMTQRVRARP